MPAVAAGRRADGEARLADPRLAALGEVVGGGDARCSEGGFACEPAPVPSTCCGDLVCATPEDAQSCAVDCGA